MTSFNNFFKEESPEEGSENLQRLDGIYGCQVCEKYSHSAYFDEMKLEMFWYCPEKHKSTQTFGG